MKKWRAFHNEWYLGRFKAAGLTVRVAWEPEPGYEGSTVYEVYATKAEFDAVLPF